MDHPVWTFSTTAWLRKAVGALAITLPGIGYGTLAWPTDFDAQVASRQAAALSNATAATGKSETYDTCDAISDACENLGTEQIPFDTRLLTYETDDLASFSAARPTGAIIVFR